MSSVGDRVWAPHEEYSWLAGRIVSIDSASVEIDTTEVGKIKLTGAAKTKLESCGSHVDQDVYNLVDLDEMSEGAILHHVRKRYNNKKIYTMVGSILVAANPFERLDIYGNDQIQVSV
jgi:myosin heavy subunit